MSLVARVNILFLRRAREAGGGPGGAAGDGTQGSVPGFRIPGIPVLAWNCKTAQWEEQGTLWMREPSSLPHWSVCMGRTGIYRSRSYPGVST